MLYFIEKITLLRNSLAMFSKYKVYMQLTILIYRQWTLELDWHCTDFLNFILIENKVHCHSK